MYIHYKPTTELLLSGDTSKHMWMLRHKKTKRFLFPYMFNTRKEMRESYIYAAWKDYYSIVKAKLTIN